MVSDIEATVYEADEFLMRASVTDAIIDGTRTPGHLLPRDSSAQQQKNVQGNKGHVKLGRAF